MAKAVYLWPVDADVRLGAAEARSLARLGITAVGLVRGDGMVGVVVDGWAFDPARHGEAAIAALCSQPPSGRLLSVAVIGVSNPTLEGGLDVPRIPTGRRAGGRGSAPGRLGFDGSGAHPLDRS